MIINITLFFFLFIALLYFGKFILLPFFLALFIYVVIKALSEKLLHFFNKSLGLKIHKIAAIFVMFTTIFSIFYFFWIILKFNLLGVKENAFNYQNNLEIFLDIYLSSPLGSFIPLDNFLNSMDLMKIFSKILNNLSNFAGNFSFIVIFLIFFIIEEKYFIKKINLIFQKKNFEILKKINSDIFYYFQLKTFTSTITGILTFMVLFFLNNDLAPTFGVFAFLLNFIPFIGSLLSVVIPFIFSMIQFLNFLEPILTLLLLLITQVFIGNILEPKLMGNTLNISPLVMIIFLALMGKIWGVAGMFLSVPMLVVILIILSRFQKTKKIAILLSDKGDS
jgi:predicted PurR-regulated permease PerM